MKIIDMPKDKKVDDFIVENGVKEFQKLIDRAEDFTPQDNEEFLLNRKSENTKLTYIIEQAFLTKKGEVKAILKIYREGNLIYSDNLNISSNKNRVTIGGAVSKACSDDELKQDVTKDLMGIDNELAKKLKEEEQNKQEQEVEQLSDEDRALGLEFLKSETLVEEIRKDLYKIGLVGEKKNGLMVYLACVSRILEDPISIIMKGSSSAGKSFIIKTVLKLFPESCKKVFSHMSAKSMLHMSKGSLKHKIVAIFERHGSVASDYSMRVLQSEKVIIVATVEKDERTGRHRTVEKVVEGPAAFLETTTKQTIHSENETRLFSFYPDESQEQTERIHRRQRSNYKLGRSDKEEIEIILRKHNAAQLLLEQKKVHIPFVDHIKLPSVKIRSRRDFDRFLSLVEVSAVLHQFQRKTVVYDDMEYIEATVDDYAVAYDVAFSSVIESLYDVPLKARRLYSLCKELRRSFTRQDMMKITGWNLEQVKKFTAVLVRKEYFDAYGSKGKTYRYEILNNLEEQTGSVLTPDQLKKKLDRKKHTKLVFKRKKST